MATVTGTQRQLTHTSDTYESNDCITVGTNILMNASCTVDGRDVSADGSKLDGIACGATACTGTVTCVDGGAGLTGGVTTSGALAVGAGTGITVNANDVAINSTCNARWNGTATTVQSNSGSWDQSGCAGINCVGDITAVTAGNGLTGGATSGAATLNVGAGTAITVAADTVGVDSTCNSTWNAKTTCTGTVTSVGTGTGLTGGTITTSGTLSINSTCNTTWNSAYTTTAALSTCAGLTCVGDITGVTAGNGLTGGATSGTATLTVGAGTAITVGATTVGVSTTCNDAWNAKTTCTGTVTSVTGGNGLTGSVTTTGSLAVGAGTGITVNADDVAINSTCNTTWNSAYTTTASLSTCAGLTCVGDITGVTAGNGLTGGGTSGSVTVNVGAGTAITVAADTVGVDSTCNSAWNAKTTCTGNLCATTGQCVFEETYYNTTLGANAGAAITTGTGSVAIGRSTLCTQTSTSGNIGIGDYAGRLNTGTGNTYLGYSAGCGSTSGSYNVGIGYTASTNSVNTGTGSYNSGIGFCALGCRSSGSGNIGIGYWAGKSITTAGYNIAFGHDAGSCIATGSYNFAAGIRALRGSSVVNSGAMIGNIAIGYETMTDNRGNYNVAFGYCTLHTNTTGASNMAIGSAALRQNTTGSCNVAIGCGALRIGTTSASNVGIGADALCYNSGSQNVGIGVDAGSHCGTGTGQNTSSDYGIYIGRRARSLTNNDQNSIVIGCEAISCGSNTVVIGNTAMTANYVAGGTWSSLSDCRYKTCINDITKGLEFIGDLKPKEFRYTKEKNSSVPYGPKRYGFLAQDVLEVEGEDNVIIDNTGDKFTYTSDYVIPVLVKAVQEQQGIIDDLKSRIEALET